MKDVYEFCPQFENEKYLLRLIEEKDLEDLHKVYSDKKAVPFFNGDNCNGDDFYYQTIERMKQAVDFWIFSYKERYFVRWTIFDKSTNQAIGTIELFHRDSENDAFDNCALLRLDLRSDYEKSTEIENILSLIINPTYDLFYCDKIATKCWKNATERKLTLEKLGFVFYEHKLVGNYGTEYGDYWVKRKINSLEELMYHSYVMGIDNSILDLEQEGFIIQKDGENFTVSFPESKADMWENFIKNHLAFEYWNEYLTKDKVVFLFHLTDGIKRFEVENFYNEEVLQLCEKLCCKFESIKKMLSDNWFYKNIIG